MKMLHPVLQRTFDLMAKAPRESEEPPPWLEERVIAAWKRMAERDVFAPHRWALACGCAVAVISAVCAVGVFNLTEHNALAMANATFWQILLQ